MTISRWTWLAPVVLLASGCATLTARSAGHQGFEPPDASIQAQGPAVAVQGSLLPAAPSATDALGPSLAPAPRPKRSANLTLELGGQQALGFTRGGLGAVLTAPVGGPFVVGGEVFQGDEVEIFSDRTWRATVYGLLGGVETAGRYTRAALLLRLGIGHGETRLGTATLPEAALRGEASLIAFDWLVLGVWGTAGRELGERRFTYPDGEPYRVGGTVLGAGLNLGINFRRAGRAAP
jgi:hypothetical protein